MSTQCFDFGSIVTLTASSKSFASGGSIVTINSPVKVYSIPVANVSYLYDQVQGGELIPVGRLADNSWWKTNYASAWIQTSEFGNTVSISGDCSGLAVVEP